MAKASKAVKAQKRRAAELDELASWLLRETARLLKRRGKAMPTRARAEVEGARDALSAHYDGDGALDLDAVEAAAEALDRALDRHCARWRKSPTREYLEAVGGAVVLALLIRAFVFEAFKIPTGSMIPTLHVHDHLFVNKFVYGPKIPFTRTRLFTLQAPRRGEIVVFEYPYEGDPDSTGKDLIKRVIATPGDLVRVKDNVIWINGAALRRDVLADGADCGESVEHLGACPDDAGRTCTFNSYDGDRVAAAFPSRAEALASIAERDGYRCQKARECGGGKVWTSQIHVGIAQSGGYAMTYNDPSWPPAHFDPQRFEAPARAYMPPQNADFPAFRVPPEHVLVMGDNRDNSKDGRYFGLVPFDTIKGRAVVIWYAYERDFYRPNFSRIGSLVHEESDDPACAR
jgi:signal peptidase I